MQCLENNGISEWADRHGLRVGEAFEVVLPNLPAVHRAAYAHGERSGDEETAASDLVARLGSWSQCIVWIRQWGVWASGEDWPAFYGWRGRLNERRSLDIAPEHLFDSGEKRLLVQLLTLIMENAWDAHILCAVEGRADRVGARISHDEWFEILGSPTAIT